MMNKNNDENAMIQNLVDAGCDKDTITVFIDELKEGKTANGLKLLAAHRRCLLDHLHKDQKRIDCLDYLVYTLTRPAPEAKGS